MRECYNIGMGYSFIRELDEYFATRYSDYAKIVAIEGYKMPQIVTVDRDGNIYRRDSEYMRISRQPDWELLVSRFKANLADTDFTFDFSFPSLGDRLADKFRKHTFVKYLPTVLEKYDMTAERVGEFLTTEPIIWSGIVKGKFYPEKNVIMAIALACGMSMLDVNNLFATCGFVFQSDNVRDIVFEYLITQKVFNRDMIRACLAEYKIDTIPLKLTEGVA